MKKIKLLVSVALVMFAVASCTKEEQIPGPAGANGTNGTSVTTNVYFVTVQNFMWTYNSSTQTHYYRWYESSINSYSIFDVYVLGIGQYQALPYVYKVGSTNTQYDYSPEITSPAYIELQYKNYNSPATAPGSNIYYQIKIAN